MLKNTLKILLHLTELFLSRFCEENCRICHQNIIWPILQTKQFNEIKAKSYQELNYCKPYLKNYFKTSQSLCENCFTKLSLQNSYLNTYELKQSLTLTVVSANKYQGQCKWLIYRFKYVNDRLLGIDLAILLLKAFQGLTPYLIGQKENLPAEYLLVPVPLHRQKLQERKYNQSYILAKNLEHLLAIKLSPQALAKVKATKSQQSLNRHDRLINLKNAFKANPQIVTGKKIILIDDVITTGATLTNCATELYRQGAIAVYGLTVAASIK